MEPLAILNSIQSYYETLYKEDKNDHYIDILGNDFTKDIHIPKIGTQERDLCELPLTESEVLGALKSMKNNSSPGLDGLPTEFYKIFWSKLKPFLMECFHFCYEIGLLAPTQRKGVITLLHKGKDLARDNLGNWRPLSLTNTDYKILAKALASRLSKSIDKIVNKDQSGFIKGRNVANMLRELADITEYEKQRSSNSIMLALDFQKAFDTISVRFMINTFKQFGFGEKFIKWIKILMCQRTAVVKNGGYMSSEFVLQRGIRQGCPISPLIFALAVEIMALSIRQSNKIKGIQLPLTHTSVKIKQYADDTTVLLRDLMDFREVLSKIKQFSMFSGLVLNKQKCEAMVNGVHDAYGMENMGIQFVKQVKILGVSFSYDTPPESLPQNWNKKIESLERTLALWGRRDLSIIGKIHIIKTFGLSLFTYLMQSVGIPTPILVRINQIFFKFIWKRKFTNTKAFEKIKRIVMQGPVKMGGLNMLNILQMQASMYLSWGEKLISSATEDWTVIPQHFLNRVGGIVIFKSNTTLTEVKGLDLIKSNFWKNVVEHWIEKNIHTDPCDGNYVNEPLFNNKNITYKQKVLFIDQYIKRNVLYVKDICTNNRLMTFQEFVETHGNYPKALLDYYLIRNALPQRLNNAVVPTRTEFKFKNIIVGAIGRRNFAKLITTNEYSYGSKIWEQKFAVTLNEKHWSLASECTKETRLRMLQWKILHNIYPTNILLNKMGIRNSQLCSTCLCIDYTEHFFFECSRTKPLWTELEKQVEMYTGTRIRIEAKHALLGYLKNETFSNKTVSEINHSILIAKMAISKVKYGNGGHIIEVFNREASSRSLWKKYI